MTNHEILSVFAVSMSTLCLPHVLCAAEAKIHNSSGGLLFPSSPKFPWLGVVAREWDEALAQHGPKHGPKHGPTLGRPRNHDYQGLGMSIGLLTTLAS